MILKEKENLKEVTCLKRPEKRKFPWTQTIKWPGDELKDKDKLITVYVFIHTYIFFKYMTHRKYILGKKNSKKNALKIYSLKDHQKTWK